jgi:hypothetical protein
MTIKETYKLGDTVWVYGVSAVENKLTQGTVVHSFNLDDYSDKYYVIEIPTAIQPLYEVRTWQTISQDKKGPIGSLREILISEDADATKKIVGQTGFTYSTEEVSDQDSTDEDPTPEEIHAALEKSQKDGVHQPLNLKESKPKRRNFPRKKKRE